jgi:hypothetical protein
MEATNKKLRQGYKQIWPSLRHRWLFDRKFWLDDIEETKELIAAARPKIERYVNFRGEFGDCDDHALLLVAEIRKQIIDKAMAGELPEEQMKPRPVGRVMGSMFRGKGPPHSLCIIDTKQGTYLFEGHEDRIWKANKENDSVFFLSI